MFFPLEFCEANLYPSDSMFVGVKGSSYVYSCQGWNAEDEVNVTWYINRKVYSEDSATNIFLIPSASNSISRELIFELSSSENNHTELFCSVEYSKTARCNSTKSIFVLQGKFENSSLVSSANIYIMNFSCSRYNIQY